MNIWKNLEQFFLLINIYMSDKKECPDCNCPKCPEPKCPEQITMEDIIKAVMPGKSPFYTFGEFHMNGENVDSELLTDATDRWEGKYMFNLQPELVASRSARSKCGIKIKRGENTKKKVIEWVAARFPKDFKFELTRHGNPKPGTDDMADSIVVALSHF